MKHRKEGSEPGIKGIEDRNRGRALKARLGIRLAGSRRAAGLTQGQLAQRVGLTTSMVSRYERGAAAPRLLALADLATELAVSVDYLLFLSRETPQRPQ